MFEFMPDLWTVFVEIIFGGFWLSVLGLVGLFSVILMLGGVSAFSIIIFNLLFILMMVMGYGYAIVTIPVWTVIVSWSIFQVYRLVTSTER